MKYLTIIILILCLNSLNAQTIEKQVIGSTGNTSSAGGMTLTATIGEVSVETKTGSFTLTEGYHQGFANESVAIKDISINVNYSLYPNPSSDVINLKLELSENISGKLDIYNTLGELVIDSKTFTGNEISANFNISNLTDGIYFLNIVFENNETHQISFVKR